MSSSPSSPGVTSTTVVIPQQSPDQAFRAALASPLVPKIYGNLFYNVLSGVDVSLLFGHHGVAAGIVTLPWPTAKALGEMLSQAVSQYEAQTHTKIGNSDQLNALIGAAGPKQ